MATTANERATIKIPAAYLEDVRAALVAEINSASDILATNQAAVLTAEDEQQRASRTEDRDASLRFLRHDVDALDRLRDAVGDTELTGDVFNGLWHMFEAMGRLLVERLREEFVYGPVDMSAVAELTARLRWTVDEARRVNGRPHGMKG